MSLKHKNITDLILKSFYEVYNELGPGFLESVYEKALEIVLKGYGLQVERQKEILVNFRGNNIGVFRADMLIDGLVILELKAVQSFVPQHEAQMLNYLKATGVEVGLLLNFGKKPEFNRFIYDKTSHGRKEKQSHKAKQSPGSDG